jgi:FtsZ-interacting cell division protein ZipA
MIELRTALIIAGLVLFVVIAMISYDRYRLARIRQQESRLRELDPDWQEPTLVRREEIDLATALPAESGHTILSPEEDLGEPSLPLDVDEFDNELREAQEVAHTPIHGINIRAIQESSLTNGDIEIDFVARIPGKNIIKRDTALGLYRQYEYKLQKRHRVFGCSYPSKVWVDLENESKSARFTHFGMTLQLADRDGAVTESELNQFSQMVLRFAEVFGRRFSFSMSFEDALEQGKTIDELYKKYDALAILNILARHGRGFRGVDIDRYARELGMDLNQRNFYQKRRASGVGSPMLYGLANLFGDGEFEPENMGEFRTDGLTLFMNIPATSKPADAFREMVVGAKTLCERLEGKLVDQNRKAMTNQGMEKISQQIHKLELEMESDRIPPGGELAIRLF